MSFETRLDELLHSLEMFINAPAEWQRQATIGTPLLSLTAGDCQELVDGVQQLKHQLATANQELDYQRQQRESLLDEATTLKKFVQAGRRDITLADSGRPKPNTPLLDAMLFAQSSHYRLGV
ncbi:hypothetical protein [Nissabacter sp. SGAir0207]|uniref:hypothetical protein n=1 Tax=Nissabacter sp. SGAir0207 TaxID=2126321 RepID=UPI0010CD693C|nr:hypothetical protein [Nissabacter sp. SGAir0207]QCR38782.1 hypothetical protein C1N62_21900 [Nissabacter sp. SGAir0207]